MYQFRPFFRTAKYYLFVLFSRPAQMPLKTRTKRKTNQRLKCIRLRSAFLIAAAAATTITSKLRPISLENIRNKFVRYQFFEHSK